MPGKVPNEHPDMCYLTRDTIRDMVRYVKDDKKIARHCGVAVETVAMVRRNCPKGEQFVGRVDFQRDYVPQGESGEGEVWMRRIAARRSNDRFMAALGRVL